MSDPWRYWRDWLARRADPSLPPLDQHVEKPEQGFYRMKTRDGRMMPVAIWNQNDKWWVKFDGQTYGGDRVTIAWQRVIEPITEAVYRAVAERGEPWPDIDPTVSEQIDPRDTIGGNNPPQDEAVLIKEQIEAAKARLAAYAEITTDDQCASAQTLRARLLELSGSAEKIRVREKQPHLDAGKAIDAKWQPLVKDAKDGADRVRRAMEAYETKKLRQQREEQRKAQEAAEAAEKAAREAAAAAERAGLPVESVLAKPSPAFDPAPKAQPTQIRGAYGKAASRKAVVALGEVTDWSALYRFFAENEEVRALLRKLADRAIASGQTVPGVTTEEKARVA
jgi:hypothetical protein